MYIAIYTYIDNLIKINFICCLSSPKVVIFTVKTWREKLETKPYILYVVFSFEQ